MSKSLEKQNELNSQMILISTNDIKKIISREISITIDRIFSVRTGNKLKSNSKVQNIDKIGKEKISKYQAAKMIGVSVPTLTKLVRNGQFSEHSLGRKKYFIKSQLIQELIDYESSDS